MEFNPNKNNFSIEKEKTWNEIRSGVDRIADKLGHPVDQGIKETVTAFLANNITTDGSCEGHADRGSRYPWIDVEVPSKEILFQKFPEHRRDIALVKEKGFKDYESLKKGDPALYEKIISVQDYINASIKEINEKLSVLLKEFYSNHTPYEKGAMISANITPAGFRVERTESRGLGLDKWKEYDEKIGRLSPSEKEQYLKNNQEEMKAFTQFLKDKFFNTK